MPAASSGRGSRWGTLDIPKRALGLPDDFDAGPPPTAAGEAAPQPPSSPRPARAGARNPPSKPLERLDAGDDWNPAPMADSAAEADLDSDPLELDLGAPASPPPRVARGRAPTGPVSAPTDARAHPAARRPATGPVEAPRIAPPRPATGSVANAPPAAGRARPARAATGPVGPDAARPPSGAQGAPRVRAPSAPLSNDAIGRAPQPRAPSAPLAAPGRPAQPVVKVVALKPSAAGAAADANHLETGMLDIDGRFADAALHQAPALDLASLKPLPKRADSPSPGFAPPAEPVRQSPPPQRERRAQELARYGQPPEGPVGAIPYFLRVYSRKRELDAQLLKLSQQRKKLDLASEDAQCLLGQALYAKGADPQLKPLAAQLRAVTESAQAVGSRAMAAKLSEEEQRFELAALERERADLAAEAAPDRMREAALRQEIETQVTQLKQGERQLHEAESVLEAARSAAGGVAPPQARVTAARAARAEQLALVQAARAELARLRPALSAVQTSLAKHAERLAQFDARRAKLAGTIDREQGRERISTGEAQSAAREALRALASAALRNDLGRLAIEEARAAIDCQERAAKHREIEELTRAATQSFDHLAYRRGRRLLTASAVGTLLLFVALIAL